MKELPKESEFQPRYNISLAIDEIIEAVKENIKNEHNSYRYDLRGPIKKAIDKMISTSPSPKKYHEQYSAILIGLMEQRFKCKWWQVFKRWRLDGHINEQSFREWKESLPCRLPPVFNKSHTY